MAELRPAGKLAPIEGRLVVGEDYLMDR